MKEIPWKWEGATFGWGEDVLGAQMCMMYTETEVGRQLEGGSCSKT